MSNETVTYSLEAVLTRIEGGKTVKTCINNRILPVNLSFRVTCRKRDNRLKICVNDS